jgi:hypothetical protein
MSSERGEQALSGTVASHRIGGRIWKIDDANHAFDVGDREKKKRLNISLCFSVLNTEKNKFGRAAAYEHCRTWANLTEQRGFYYGGSYRSVKDP